MQKYLLIIFFIAAGLFTKAQNNIDVLHYEYHLDLSDQHDTVYGRAKISFLTVQPCDSIIIDLVGTGNGKKGMIVTKTLWDPFSAILLPFRQDNNKLYINLGNHHNSGDTSFVTIHYKGIPDDGLIISKNKYGDKTFFADNWPNRAHHWIPCVDRPDDKASFEFIVTAPSKYSVVSNGIKIEEKEIDNGKKVTHWREDIPLPTKIMVIGVSRFAVKTFDDSPAGIPVSAWVYPQDSTAGFKNYSPAPSILKFLSDYIGPYPYKKLANVQSKTIFGGMENASAIFYYEESASSERNVESLLAHEIVHQWFGDMTSEKSFPHLWLSEGFATYLTHIYIESKYGTDSLNNEMKQDRNDVLAFSADSKLPVVDSITPFKNLLNANSYQKGGWVLHMLRRQLGDIVFQKIIRSYYAAYAGKNADTRDFQKICEKESGKDLTVFFDQWLYSYAFPKLEVQWSYDEKNKMAVVNIKQLQTKLLEFPLDIKLGFGSEKSVTETLSISKKSQQFLLPAKQKPLNLLLDPNTSLLFEGSAHKLK